MGRDEWEPLPDGKKRKFSDLMSHETEIMTDSARVEAFNYFLKTIQLCFGEERFQPKLVFQGLRSWCLFLFPRRLLLFIHALLGNLFLYSYLHILVNIFEKTWFQVWACTNRINNDLDQVYCRILINSVEITDDFQESIGTGIFLALRKIIFFWVRIKFCFIYSSFFSFFFSF